MQDLWLALLAFSLASIWSSLHMHSFIPFGMNYLHHTIVYYEHTVWYLILQWLIVKSFLLSFRRDFRVRFFLHSIFLLWDKHKTLESRDRMFFFKSGDKLTQGGHVTVLSDWCSGNTSGVSFRVFPERLNWELKIHPEHGWNHHMVWPPVLN